MPYYVYIIQSETDRSYYKGFTENPVLRLQHHNNGDSTYTRSKKPWKLVYVEECSEKSVALKRERNLKKIGGERLDALLIYPKNIVSQFL